MNIFVATKKLILDLLFPVLCLNCQKEGEILCEQCRNSLSWLVPTCFVCRKMALTMEKMPAGRTCAACRKKTKIFAYLSPFSYDSTVIRELIHSLKYSRIKMVSGVFADLLRQYFNYQRVFFPPNSLFIPIPLHKSRKRIRGFNQTELISCQLEKLLGIPVQAGILKKIRKTAPQTELSATERRQNVINSFAVFNAEAIKNKIILLVDDVKTTGATLEEAARVLKKAGAKQVWTITVAH